MKKNKIVIILGPTATGKSSLAVRLCRDFNGCVINADSVQLYKHLNIAAAKPAKEEMGGVPHYLIDVLDPKESFSAAQFREAAIDKINQITASGENVFIVGGTGLYVKILTGGIIDVPESDEKVRVELKERAGKEGTGALYDELKAVDEAAAKKIGGNDLFRIIRALEIYKATGVPVSKIRKGHSFKDEEFSYLKIGLSMDRARLYARIEKRVDKMIAAGLEDEVRGLLKMGYTADLKPLLSIGYKQMMMYIDGGITLDEAARLMKRETKRYAKRQLTWFNKEKDILWYDAKRVACGDEYASIKEKVSGYLGDI